MNEIHPNTVVFESSVNEFKINLGSVNPTVNRTIHLANSSVTLIPFSQPSTTTITADTRRIKFTLEQYLEQSAENDVVTVDINRDVTGIHTINAENITDGTITISNGVISGLNTIQAPKNVTFEGSTVNDFQTRLETQDPTENRIVRLADSCGDIIPFTQPSTTTITATPEELNLLSGTISGTVSDNDVVTVDSNRDVTGIRSINSERFTDGTTNISNGVISGLISVKPQNVTFEGSTINEFQTIFQARDPTGDRTINLADSSGTLIPFSQPQQQRLLQHPKN